MLVIIFGSHGNLEILRECCNRELSHARALGNGRSSTPPIRTALQFNSAAFASHIYNVGIMGIWFLGALDFAAGCGQAYRSAVTQSQFHTRRHHFHRYLRSRQGKVAVNRWIVSHVNEADHRVRQTKTINSSLTIGCDEAVAMAATSHFDALRGQYGGFICGPAPHTHILQ